MAMLKDLLSVLEDSEEPLSKRMKIADHAFKSVQTPIQHKEAVLLKWAFNNLNVSDNSLWILVDNWLASEQFKDLVQNNVSNDDISALIELFLEKIEKISVNDLLLRKLIKDSAILVINQRVFSQYFKHNIKLYCKFVSHVIQKINCPLQLIEFLRNPNLFPKKFLIEGKFCKYFLDYICPAFVNNLIKYKDNAKVFEDISKVTQKCLFQENFKNIQSFFDNYMNGKQIEKGNILQDVFKYLMSVYYRDSNNLNLNVKLIFHSFCLWSNDFSLIYKFSISTLSFLNFDMKSNFNIQFSKQLDKISLSKSTEILLILLEEINNKGFTEQEILNISFTDFMRKILKTLIFLKAPTPTVYEIFLKTISINPLTIEPMVNQVVIFLMTTNNEKQVSVYEKLVISIFEVFSKLHRVENFVSKLIQALKMSLIDKFELQTDNLEDLFQSNGENDVIVSKSEKLSANSVLTENILRCFTTCINSLASWQVINLMKTFLFHLNISVKEYLGESSENDDKLIFLEILGTLFCQLLHSVRMAEHTIPQNVVTKYVGGLDELKGILKEFGLDLLKKEHNHITMRTFLKIAYTWAEVYMMLTYYSINNEVEMIRVLDNIYTACNLMYLHSYLDVRQWQLISQRIMNFGEYPCKKLLQKLFIQKLRAMLLFEKNITEDIILNVVKTLQTNLDDTCEDLLLDKFFVNFILPKMDAASLTLLSEHLIEEKYLHDQHHIKDSVTLLKTTTYVVMSKINKLFKNKRKHDQESNKGVSSRIFTLIPKEIFFKEAEDGDLSEIIETIKKIDNEKENNNAEIGKKEEKCLFYLYILRKLPIIYSSIDIQKMVLLYLYYLYNDLSGSKALKSECESLIIGILQNCKFQLTDIFHVDTLCTNILINFEKYGIIFSLIVDNVFKNKDSINSFESAISCLLKNLNSTKYLESTLIVLQSTNKIKKSKMDSTVKEVANNYKEKILNKMVKLVCKSEFLIEAYGSCLKNYLSLGQESATLNKLTERLPSYMDYALENISNENKRGCVILFTTLLHNKQKLSNVAENVVLKIWNACKSIDVGDEYSHLINLIVTLIPNEEFKMLVDDLLELTQKSINERNYPILSRQLKIWESILTCNVNPIKMKLWQEALESLIEQLLNILRDTECDLKLIKDIVHLQENIILTQHFIISPPLIDLCLINITIITKYNNQDFEEMFNMSTSLLEKLLKYRNAVIMDRLPPFLQQYRTILKLLCENSSSDQNENALDIKKASHCAHKLEKLTKKLVLCKKDMGRIAVFLIADILERYEQINLYPNVKLHLNNCIYSLVSLCDRHSISYLMRVLSSASTEMFKILYEHYKKYYMFTGKV